MRKDYFRSHSLVVSNVIYIFHFCLVLLFCSNHGHICRVFMSSNIAFSSNIFVFFACSSPFLFSFIFGRSNIVFGFDQAASLRNLVLVMNSSHFNISYILNITLAPITYQNHVLFRFVCLFFVS